MAAATAQNRIDHRAPLAGFRMPHKEKVLLSNRRGANGVFAQIIINLQPAILHVARQSLPPAQRKGVKL